MSNIAKSLPAGVIAWLLTAGSLLATPITQPELLNDSFVLKEFPDNPQLLEPNLVIKNAASGTSSDFDRKIYLQYNVTGLGGLDLDYSLGLEFISGEGKEDNITGNIIDFSVYGLVDGDPGEFWDEGLLTWNQAPANNTLSGSDFLSNATFLGNFSVWGTGAGTRVDFRSADLNAFLKEDTNQVATLMISRVFEDPLFDGYVHEIVSKETGTGPVLTVVPEPSLIGFCGLGLVLFYLVSKRRFTAK